MSVVAPCSNKQERRDCGPGVYTIAVRFYEPLKPSDLGVFTSRSEVTTTPTQMHELEHYLTSYDRNRYMQVVTVGSDGLQDAVGRIIAQIDQRCFELWRLVARPVKSTADSLALRDKSRWSC